MTLHDALVEAEHAGVTPTLAELAVEPATGSDEVVALADTPIAPLAAAALARSLPAEPGWTAGTAAFATRVAAQRSLLALRDSIDILLDEAAPAAAAATALHAALLADVDGAATAEPYLCLARIEGALRVALAGATTPYLVLHHLASIPSDAGVPYREGLPRLIGIALDRWDADVALTAPLLTVLHALRADDDAAAGAAYELASHEMRVALRHGDPDASVQGLDAAAKAFAEAGALDEARDDAAAYAAVCTAVVAFARGDLKSVVSTRGALTKVIARWREWHHGMHQPQWRRPALDAHYEWFALVLDLEQAAERLVEPSWLDATAAVGQLARAYAAERSTLPVRGLAGVIRPAIENPVAASAVLADQLARAVEADREREMRVLPDSADLLVRAVRERGTQRSRRTPSQGDGTDDADREGEARLRSLAPHLLDLPPAVALAIAGAASDSELRELDQLVSLATVSSGISDHPVLAALHRDIVAALEQSPSFEGPTRAATVALLEYTLTFLHDRYDRGGSLLPGLPNILRQLEPGEARPHERELQEQFYIWLANAPAFAGRADLERRNIASGRADVILTIGAVRLVTEVKRELDGASRDALDQYVPQAAAYSGSNVPYSQLLVLDLTDHTAGVPPLADLLWLGSHRAREDASPQYVVVAVVPGNRPTPSALVNHGR